MKKITFEIPDELRIMTFTMIGHSSPKDAEIVVSVIDLDDGLRVCVAGKDNNYHVTLGGESK